MGLIVRLVVFAILAYVVYAIYKEFAGNRGSRRCQKCEGNGFWRAARGEKQTCDVCKGAGRVPKY